MDLTTPATGYSVFLAGVFLAMLVVARLPPLLIRLARCVRRLILEYLCYRYVVSRHAILGPWSAATFLLHLVYTSANLGCVYWGPATVSEAASRAGILSMINMAPVVLSTHLSFLADLFGVSLRTYRRIHRSCGIAAASLLLMHSILSLAESGSFSLEGWPNRFAVMGISAVFLLLLLSIRILRQVSYELFLRLHQALAGLFVFCAAKHLVSLEKDRDFWLPIYAFAGVCAALTVVQGSLLIYRNKAWGQPCPRAMIQHAEGTIEVTVVLSRPCRFHAGQYIVLWVPSLSLWSSHPFTVVSWSPERQSTLKLVIEPRKGFTDRLLRRSTLETSRLMCHRALFSGPHGHRLSLAPYKTVIIFAEAAGLTAVLPHLKELIHAYKKGQGLARRIHLVWQVHSYAQLAAKKPLIDEILIDDSLEDGYILCGSIYDTSADVKKRCGRHYRITLSPGQPDVQEIIRKEHTGSFIFKEPDEDPDEAYEDAKRPTQPLGMLAAVDQEDAIRKAQRFKDADGDTLVLVSAREAMRDAVRAVVRGYIREGFHLEELDYQPA